MSLTKALGSEPVSQKPYTVVAINQQQATLQRGNDYPIVPNNGYSVGQTVLFDGNTVLTQPAEITLITI